MVIFKDFKRQNFIKIYTKTHQIDPFQKHLSGTMPPNPPRFVTCQFPDLKKNYCPPPPAKSWLRPW